MHTKLTIFYRVCLNETGATQRIVALHKLPKIYRLISQGEQRSADELQCTLFKLEILKSMSVL